jgi:hypothetical protein
MRESCLEITKNNIKKPGPPPGRSYKDFSGQKIGNLTIIKRVERPIHSKILHSYWLCRCSCGNELSLPTSEFRHRTKCKECANKEMRIKLSTHFKDLTNKRFG